MLQAIFNENSSVSASSFALFMSHTPSQTSKLIIIGQWAKYQEILLLWEFIFKERKEVRKAKHDILLLNPLSQREPKVHPTHLKPLGEKFSLN